VEAEAIHQENGWNLSVDCVGQFGKLRPIVNRPECPRLPDMRR
jgi:hypothetical protein